MHFYRPFHFLRNADQLEITGSDRPYQTEFARLNFTHTVLSKRLLKHLVEQKVVDGWDDPRMPTLRGFRKRGYPATAIRSFCEHIGVARTNGDIGFLYDSGSRIIVVT